jgi:hypothetical protein
LEKQQEEEDKMRNFLNKQLKGKDEQLTTLVKDFEMARNWLKKS